MDSHKTVTNNVKKMKKKKSSDERISFSAALPGDVQGVFADSMCAVKLSSDPLTDFKESIVAMIREAGVRSWEEMEELVYCYVVLNSAETIGIIRDAFLSLPCSSYE